MAFEGLYIVAAILIAGAALAKLAEKHQFPYPVPLIIAGLILGQVFPGALPPELGVDFVAQLALAAVLFYAGLTMNVKELRTSLRSVLMLATVGVLLTSLIAGFITVAVFAELGLTAFLIGAILSPTDPAALFSVLESGGIRVKRRIFSILEGEAVFNDATAVILVITVFLPFVTGVDTPPVLVMLWQFLASMGLGVLVGFGLAYGLGKILIQSGEETNVAIITATAPILAFGIGEIFGEIFGIHSGALAAVFAGIFMANSRQIGLETLPQKSMRGVMKKVSFAFEIVVFILLGYTVNIAFLMQNQIVIPLGLVIAVLIIFVARPVSVFLVTAPDKTIGFKDRFLVSWAGVKGVASAALAAIAASAIMGAGEPTLVTNTIYSITFIVLMMSLIVQGVTTPIFAKRLGLIEEEDVAEGITAKRDATRQALLHLVDTYTEGKVEVGLYSQLKAELEEDIFNLEDELRQLVSEKRARIKELEMREQIYKSKLAYYQKQYEEGKLADSIYEDQRRELETELDEIETRKRLAREN